MRLSVDRNCCLVAVLLTVAVTACSPDGTRGGSTDREPVGPPTIGELSQATISGIYDEPVNLVDGRWEGEPSVNGGASRPSVGLVEHFILSGDLDGEGLDDSAVLVWESSGGSGTQLYLTAATRVDDGIATSDAVLIGDRVHVRSGAIADRRITLDIVQSGPKDAACCPTQKALITWTLSNGALTRMAAEVTGSLSLADLEGPEWTLLEFGRGQTTSDDPEITLLFQGERASGMSACNSYFAGVSSPEPGRLRFNGMGATRMACPDEIMALERRYLTTLAGASGYSFQAGRLVLTCDTDEGPVALIYGPKP